RRRRRRARTRSLRHRAGRDPSLLRDQAAVGPAGPGVFGRRPTSLSSRLSAAGSVGVLHDNGRMTTYGAEYLNRLLDAVTGFQSAFDAWMTTQVESDHLSARGLFPTAWTREGEDETKVKQLELAVAEAAGAAARAV